jgi:hypothetical protein
LIGPWEFLRVGFQILTENFLGDSQNSPQIWDRRYDFSNIFAKKIGEKLVFLTQNKAKFFKNWIITLSFVKNANFAQKIGENRRKLWS